MQIKAAPAQGAAGEKSVIGIDRRRVINRPGVQMLKSLAGKARFRIKKAISNVELQARTAL